MNQNNHRSQPIINQKCNFHEGEILSLLCTQQDCSKNGLICVNCQYSQHKNHNAKPVAWILDKIKKDSVITSTVLKLTTKIDTIKLQAQATLNQNINQQLTDKQQIQKAIDFFFSKYQNQLNIKRSAYNKIVQKNISFEETKQYLKKYIIYTSENQQQKAMTNLQLFLKQILSITQQRVKQFKLSMKQKLQLNQILQIFLSQAEKKVKYTFSSQFKHKSITITQQLKATQKNNYSTNFVVVQPLVESKNKKCRGKKSIKFRIDRLMSWISIGVGYLSYMKKSNYYFNTSSVGHGGFLLSNNGYTWHHSDSSFNSFYAQWDFVQGDVITVTVQPRKKMITFSKDGANSYQLAFEPIVGDQLYFVASLSSHDESISIQQ